ncbi:hypothetical protein KV205_19355 [Streptomyces sp. SKN60]|uniref:hypothetical protein n=1 Tax=Streptomyces sp. SKN60 TaxID=2855506 RepID=UPI0022457DA1|nr:hypothetical protein [Streptomyces sp. SKN60]MCX2182670.1 hypothetical protein [Streptomyces sp. SKN60]
MAAWSGWPITLFLLIPVGTAVYGRVRDSSSVHPINPARDGQRVLTCCSAAHLAELQQHYRRRPFVNEELWAMKIDRAMRQHSHRLTNEQLIRETGLNLIQLEASATWRYRRHYDIPKSAGEQ